MKQYQKNILYTATLIIATAVIPAKAGIQTPSLRKQGTIILEGGFPRIEHPVSSTGQAKAGSVEPGMTNRIRLMSSCIVLIITFLLSVGILLIEPMKTHGQSKEKMGLSQELRRDPFLLPSGIRLLSKNVSIPGKSETKPIDTSPLPLKVNTILISDHIRLASIDRHIVTIGDSIFDEKVLEIKADQVVLGKGDKKRTIFLDQSPIKLTVER